MHRQLVRLVELEYVVAAPGLRTACIADSQLLSDAAVDRQRAAAAGPRRGHNAHCQHRAVPAAPPPRAGRPDRTGHLTRTPPADGGGVRRGTGGLPAALQIAVKCCADPRLRQTPAASTKNEVYPRAKNDGAATPARSLGCVPAHRGAPPFLFFLTLVFLET